MDRQGWVSVSEFIEKFNEKFRGPMFYLTLPVLMEIVRTDQKQRYGLRREGEQLMIRCNQGHSISWRKWTTKRERRRRFYIMERVSVRWILF